MFENCTCKKLWGQDIEAELIFVGVSIFSGSFIYKCPKCGLIHKVNN